MIPTLPRTVHKALGMPLSSLYYRKKLPDNLARGLLPKKEGEFWAADFTYLPFKKGFVFLATVMDVFTREVIGWTMMFFL